VRGTSADSAHSRWWQNPGSLRAFLVPLDDRLGAVVNVEKDVVDTTLVSGEVAGQLGWVAQRMGLSTGNGMVEQSDRALGFEPAKPGYTREAGLIQRQAPPHRLGS
jgi:hypothetical protein